MIALDTTVEVQTLEALLLGNAYIGIMSCQKPSHSQKRKTNAAE